MLVRYRKSMICTKEFKTNLYQFVVRLQNGLIKFADVVWCLAINFCLLFNVKLYSNRHVHGMMK